MQRVSECGIEGLLLQIAFRESHRVTIVGIRDIPRPIKIGLTYRIFHHREVIRRIDTDRKMQNTVARHRRLGRQGVHKYGIERINTLDGECDVPDQRPVVFPSPIVRALVLT